MKVYADSNFFARLYLSLPGSTEVAALLHEAKRKSAPPLPVTWLHRVEIINALQLYVFAAGSQGRLRVTAEQSAAAQAHFREDLRQSGFVTSQDISFPSLERQAEELSLRHTAKRGFRTYDLLHVAAALLLKCDTFWSFDVKASRLAALEGLRIPNSGEE